MSHPRRGSKGAAWNQQVFTSSAVAVRGGPVRRNVASIRRNSSRLALYREARKRGWCIIRIGPEWLLYRGALPVWQVLGPLAKRGRL